MGVIPTLVASSAPHWEPRPQPGLLPAASRIVALIQAAARGCRPRCSTALDSSPLTTCRCTCPPSVSVVPVKGATLREVANVPAASQMPPAVVHLQFCLAQHPLIRWLFIERPKCPWRWAGSEDAGKVAVLLPRAGIGETWLCRCLAEAHLPLVSPQRSVRAPWGAANNPRGSLAPIVNFLECPGLDG